MIDFDALLAPVSADSPGGPDLSYDDKFIELETLSQGRPEREYGTTVIPAVPPRWADLRTGTQALLTRSKDLRAAVWLTRAMTAMEGVSGCVQGLELLERLVQIHWEHLHPALDAEDGNNPVARIHALSPLDDPYTMVRELRAAVLVRSRAAGVIRVRDIEIGMGRLQSGAGDTPFTADEIAQRLRAAVAESPDALAAGCELEPRISALLLALNARLPSEDAQRFALLSAVAQVIGTACRAASPLAGMDKARDQGDGTGAVTDPAAGHALPDDPAGIPPASSPRLAPPAEIQSRADAMAALDRVCAWLERHEPTNPAPLLIRRAKAVMGKDFLAIMADLAPDGVAQVRAIAGIREEER